MKPTTLRILAASLLLLAGSARAQTFTGANLGTQTLSGSATKNADGTITIVGGGADIWGTVDGGYYYYTSVSGQAWDAVVRVRNLTGPDNWTKCELMVRQDDGSGNPFPQGGDAFIADMTTRSAGQNEIGDQYRANNGGSANWVENSPVTRPTYPNTWLRIRRAGSVFRIQYGTDGTNWNTYIDIDTATTATPDFNGTPWPDPIYVGVAVTAHNDTDTTGGIATISDLSVRPVAAPTAVGVAQQVQNTTVYNGTEAALSMVVTNSLSNPVSYQWYKNGQLVTNATSTLGKFTFLATPADNGAKVYCQATVIPFSSTTLTSATGTVTVLTGSLTYTNGLKEEMFLGATRGTVEGGAVGKANSVNLLPGFEAAINDGINNYAHRVSGYFIPPVTTNYVFFVCSDDDSDLFLSTDSSPANKRLIAQETVWSNSRQWQSSGGGSTLAQKRSDQWSPDGGVTTPYASGISLTAGQLYYIEGVHHQGGGGDNFAATYTYLFAGNTNPADGDAPLLQATNYNIALITSPTTNLVWVTQPASTTVFEAQQAILSASAISDSEFAVLYQWYRNGSPVTNANSATYGFVTSLADNGSQWYLVAHTAEGGLSITSSVATVTVQAAVLEKGWAKMEYWPGQTATTAVEAGTAGAPAFTMAVPAFESGVNNENGDNYVNRVSGYFIPPATASYTFFVNSDDNSDLFLSTDDTVANKRLIAQETGWSNPWQWVAVGSGTVSQKRSDQWSPDGGTTVPYANGIAMTAGKKYYLEAVHHEGGGGDNVEVNYIKVGDPDPLNGTDTALKGNVIAFNAVPTTSEAFTLQPVSVTVTSAYTATFTAAGTSDSQTPAGTTGQFYSGSNYLTFPLVTYQWYSNGVAISGATATSYTTPLVLPSNNGDQYVCAIRGLGYPTWSNSLPATLTVITDTNPPTLVYGAVFTNINLLPPVEYIDVTFNKRMDIASLGQMANYTIPGATVTGITINSNDFKSVQLTFSGTPTSPVSVQVNGVKSFSGTAVAAASSIAVQTVPLTSQDIGLPDPTTGAPDPAQPGLMYVEGPGAYTISAEGSDIWNNADGFNFSYEMKTNDFDVVVRQKYITHTSNWAKGGLMARETLDPGSRDWNIINDPLASDGIMAPDGSGTGASLVECNSRVTTNGASASWGNTSTPDYPNAWVRLKRTGQVFTAYNSTNGTTWNLLATQDPTKVGESNSLPAAIYVGICVTAHNNDPLSATTLQYYNTSVFDNYNSSYVYVPPLSGATLQAAVSAGNIVISWTPSGGHLETSAAIGPAAAWSMVGTNNPTTNALSGAQKYFRVIVP